MVTKLNQSSRKMSRFIALWGSLVALTIYSIKVNETVWLYIFIPRPEISPSFSTISPPAHG